MAQFRSAVDGVLDTLFARPDGVELAGTGLKTCCARRPVFLVRAERPRKQMINRIGILAHALSSRMTPRRDQDAWIRERNRRSGSFAPWRC